MRPVALRFGLSGLAAVAMFLAAPTANLWPLMWLAMVPQIHVALTSATPKRAFLHGWLTGIIANTAGFWWMRELLERFGHMPAVEAIPIMMLLTSYQGLEFALFSWGVYRVRQRTQWPMVVVAPLVMVAIELCTPQIFPFYLAITQAWIPAVIQIADLTGPLGVTFVLLATNGGIYDAWTRWRAGEKRAARRPLIVVAALIAFTLVYGQLRIHQVDARRAAAPKAKAGLVQANVGILEKWDPAEFARLLDTHQRLSVELVARGADLVVWPESSYPYALRRDITHDFPEDDPRRIARGFDKPLVFGAVTMSAGPRKTRADRYPYNTALMRAEGGAITAKFDKVFLMLFGEYIPFYDQIPWFTKIFPEASNFNRGTEPASLPFSVAGRSYRLGPLICYEDIIPGFTRRVANLDPNLFVNITNDAWFGRTAEPHQHLALAVFRSVEHRLEMLRAVNTGVSAHIDAVGRVVQQTASVDPAVEPPPQPVTLLAEVALLDGGGIYRYVGDLFGMLCLGVLVAGLVLRGQVPMRRPAQARKAG
ncbi:MAG TPA: apolipoprotein N-acyltransferase [Polyangia bacterium]|jgi:apolipoprotein N-acyltransferase